MSEGLTQIRIHMCDDDPDDQLLVSDALEEARLRKARRLGHASGTNE